jgi:hypothetical protein
MPHADAVDVTANETTSASTTAAAAFGIKLINLFIDAPPGMRRSLQGADPLPRLATTVSPTHKRDHVPLKKRAISIF